MDRFDVWTERFQHGIRSTAPRGLTLDHATQAVPVVDRLRRETFEMFREAW
jgi:hypothetical protein